MSSPVSRTGKHSGSSSGRRAAAVHAAMVILALAALIVALALLAGCGKSVDTASTTAGTATSPAVTLQATTPAGTGALDSMTWDLTLGEPTTLDPLKAGDYGPCFVSSQLHDTLVRYSPEWKLGPGIAESWTQPDDKTIVYAIRTDAKFWDGNPVTADDVVYSLSRHMDPKSGSIWGAFFSNVKSITKTGDSEVTVSFSQPDELFNKEMGTSAGGIVEQAYVEKVGAAKYGSGTKVMGSGPYVLKDWKPGSEIDLTANPSYWDPALQPKVANVTLKFITETSTVTSGLLSGELDGAYEVPPTSIPALKSASTGTLYFGPSLSVSEVVISDPSGPMGDPKLRGALSMAIDRQAIVDKVFNGAAVANKTIVPSTAWDPEAVDVYKQAYDALPSLTPDIAAAKKIVESTPGATKPMVMAVLAGDQRELELASVVQQAAKDIGMTIKLKQLQPMDMSNYFYVPEYRKGIDMGMTLGFLDVPDSLDYTSYFLGKDALFNWIGYSNPTAEKQLETARQTLDAQARAQLITDAQASYTADTPVIPLAMDAEILFMNNKISGAPVTFTYMWIPSLAMIGGTQ
jgi:peptide/nickel transport system substrate-binding protein